MYDFDDLVREVLRSRPEISKESLMEQVKEKKRTVGSGYLTDQGALFLIAGELGVRLQDMVTADLTLKDLHIGANDITVVARVLAIYPIAEFTRKDGSGVGRYRRVNLFDRNGVAKLTIWEDNEEAMKLSGIVVDMPVRVISAYVKQSRLDGKPNLNLGKRGRIEAIIDPAISSKIDSLSTLAKGVEAVQEGEVIPAVDGLVVSDSRRSTFVRRDDGSSGSLTQFELKGPGNGSTRVVIWNGSDSLQVKSGSSVRVTNLRHKRGRQNEAELHGDGATVIQLLGADIKKEGSVKKVDPPLIKVADVARHAVTGKVSLDVMALSKGTVREVSLKDGSTAKKGEVVFGDDTGEITAVAWDEVSKVIGEIQAGEKVRVHGALIQLSKMGVETLELNGLSKVERSLGR